MNVRERQKKGASYLLISVVVIFGLGLRLYALGRGSINSDEAVVGLMARSILHGHFSAFFWGQNYGGAEPYLVAVFFAIFGQSSFTLGLVPMFLDACAAVLVWRIGRRLISSRVGAFGAVMFWIWPEIYVHQSTIEDGFRWLSVVLGLSLVLVVLQIAKSDHARSFGTGSQWALLGLLLGVGWWTTPEIVYYVIPSAIYLLGEAFAHHVAPRARHIVPGLLCAGIGATPWLYVNVGSGFSSLKSFAQPRPGFGVHLRIFWDHVLPIVMGLQLPESGRFALGRIGEVILVVAVIAAVAWICWLIRRRRALLLVLCVVCFPFLYASSPFSWFWQDGRYAVHFASFMALLFASLVISVFDRLRALERQRWIRFLVSPAVAIMICVALTIGDASQLSPFTDLAVAGSPRATVTSWQPDPNKLAANLVGSLHRAHIDSVYAGYWLAYVLDFESHGTVTAAVVGGSQRYGAYQIKVEQASQAGWIFSVSADRRNDIALNNGYVVDPSCSEVGQQCFKSNQLERYLRQRHVAWRQYRFGGFDVVVPDRSINPAKALLSAGLPPTV